MQRSLQVSASSLDVRERRTPSSPVVVSVGVSSFSVVCAHFVKHEGISRNLTVLQNIKMKSIYVISALIGVTITLALAKTETPHEAQVSNSSHTVDSSQNIATTSVPSNETTSPIIPASNTTTSTATNTTTSTTTTSTNTPPTTAKPTKPTEPTKPTSTTELTPPTTIHTTPTVVSSTGAGLTTAIPSSPSPSKDRQFDGLSFFGGIILTTCLMAIAAFSWKFYRQCKEGNYRTL